MPETGLKTNHYLCASKDIAFLLQKFKKKAEAKKLKRDVEKEETRDIIKEIGLDQMEGVAALGVYELYRPEQKTRYAYCRKTITKLQFKICNC